MAESQHALSILLSINKLTEFFKRADPLSNKLKMDLDELLLPNNIYTKISIKNDFTQELHNKRTPTCSIYISFFRNTSNILICHFSLHFDPYCKNSKGRYHIQNNINKERCHTLKVNIRQTEFSLNILQSPQIMRNEVKYCSNALEVILRDYLDSESLLSLSKQLTNINTINPCVQKILLALKRSKSKINKTRKKYSFKTKSSINQKQ